MRRKTSASLLAMTASATLALGLGLAGTGSATAADHSPAGHAPATTSSAPTSDDVLTAPDVAELPKEQVKAMKRDLHLGSRKQVQARLNLDTKAGNIERRVATSLGKSYAGTWVSKDGAQVVVGVTDAQAAAKVRAAGATAKIVRRSLDTLEAAHARLDAQSAKAGTKVAGWHVDPESNKVVVTATTAAAAAKFATAAGLDPAIVTTEIGALPEPVADLRGGDEYRHINSNSGGVISYTMCSIGFPVTQGGFVTAGHCGTAGQTVTDTSFNDMGSFQASTFPGNDYAWVKTNSNWSPTGQVNNYSGGNWIPVFGSDEAAVGASVCRSGRTTHWQCGVILSKNFTINYSSGPVYGAVDMTACAAGGDSGGSVISGNQAQGVMSGISGSCGDSGFHSFYQPVNPILSQYNLTLALGTSIQGLNNKCIDVPSSNFTDSVQLQIWNCNGTNAQAFRFQSDGTIRVGGMCMDLRQSNTSDGNAVQIYHCNGTQAQQFTLNSAGDLVSVLADKCVDVKDNNGNNGAKLQIWTCTGGSNQKWHKH